MSSGCGCKDVYRFPHITYAPINGYEVYVCVCFFMYKTLCAAFIWLPWDACSCSYVCLYIKFNYKKVLE